MLKINEVVVIFENCESVTFKGSDVLDFKMKEDHHTLIKSFKNSACKLIRKTHNSFLLKVSNSAEQIGDFRRTDVAAIEVFFERNISTLFNVEWGLDDCSWSYSSKQKIIKDENSTTWISGDLYDEGKKE